MISLTYSYNCSCWKIRRQEKKHYCKNQWGEGLNTQNSLWLRHTSLRLNSIELNVGGVLHSQAILYGGNVDPEESLLKSKVSKRSKEVCLCANTTYSCVLIVTFEKKPYPRMYVIYVVDHRFSTCCVWI